VRAHFPAYVFRNFRAIDGKVIGLLSLGSCYFQLRIMYPGSSVIIVQHEEVALLYAKADDNCGIG